MKNIVVITDSAKIADLEFKALRQNLMDKGLLVKYDAVRCILYTSQMVVCFWNSNGGIYPMLITSDTIAYSNCKIGIRENEPIVSQIRKWQRIEQLIENMPQGAEEIPYSDIENLKIWGADRFEVKE